jgi:hypothetical protein
MVLTLWIVPNHSRRVSCQLHSWEQGLLLETPPQWATSLSPVQSLKPLQCCQHTLLILFSSVPFKEPVVPFCFEAFWGCDLAFGMGSTSQSWPWSWLSRQETGSYSWPLLRASKPQLPPVSIFSYFKAGGMLVSFKRKTWPWQSRWFRAPMVGSLLLPAQLLIERLMCWAHFVGEEFLIETSLMATLSQHLLEQSCWG